MCQGLPCVGARVALVRNIDLTLNEGQQYQIRANTEGIIESEDLKKRTVTVRFEGTEFRVTLSESDVREVRKPLNG
jgi:hypothetical protein